jgi:transposase
MASRQASAPLDLASFAALVGIDWADQKHDVALRAAGADHVELRQIDHTPEALDEWAMQLRRRFDGPIAVAIELSRGPLVNALMKYGFITIFPIPPARLASYRDAFSSSGAKNDPADAHLILDYLQKHAEQLRPWVPDDPQTRELAMLCESRRKLVDLQTKFGNMLQSTLKLYYPQARQWLDDLRTKLACDFLHRWPTLEAVQRATPNSIRKFFRDHNSRRSDRIEHIIEQVRTAVPLTADSAIIAASSRAVVALARQLRVLSKSIGELDSRIAELFPAHPDAPIFRSLPGAGVVLAPRLLVAMGTDRSRYEDAAQVQTYSGIAPVMIRSGKTTRRVRRRFACPKFLRQTFQEFAEMSIRFCDWAHAYYQDLRQRGVKHHAAIRSLAFKWIRVIYACWRDRICYDNERYKQALRAAGSPIVKLIP